MRTRLHSPFINEIKAYYHKIMLRITSESDAKKLVLRVLSWIMYAKRFLLIDELREVIWVEDEDERLNSQSINSFSIDDIIERCESLVTYDKTTRQVKFSHTTVQEFLDECDFTVELMPHAALAKTCLTYLNFEAFNAPCTSIQSLSDRANRYQFGDYAATYWAVHTRNANIEDVISQHTLFAIVDNFQQEGIRESMEQMRNHAKLGPKLTGKSLLHLLVENKLATYYIPPSSDKFAKVGYA